MRFLVSVLMVLCLVAVAPAFAKGAVLAAPAGTDATIASLNAKGVEAYNGGDLNSAYTYFESAIKMDGGFAVGQYNIAVVLDAEGKHAKAAAHFAQAKALAPNDPSITKSAILISHTK